MHTDHMELDELSSWEWCRDKYANGNGKDKIIFARFMVVVYLCVCVCLFFIFFVFALQFHRKQAVNFRQACIFFYLYNCNLIMLFKYYYIELIVLNALK